MRKALTIFPLLLFVAQLGFSQTETEAVGDTTIYAVAEEAPRFPGCEQLDTTDVIKQQCSQQRLLAYIYQNMTYPAEAIRGDHEGTVVVSFVIEKDGTISNPEVVREVPGGCSEEALRIVQLMNPFGVRWMPGKKEGEAVRTKFNLPVRFRLSDARPYEVIGRDSIWSIIDEAAEFIGGPETLKSYLNTEVKYPPIGNDSCMVGDIPIQVVVRRDGDVKVLDMQDNSNLGIDFWWEAITAVHKTAGRWKPAVFKGEVVPAAYDFVVPFRPTASACRQVVSNYERAQVLMEEGVGLFNEGKQEEGIAKLTEAIELAPRDANMYYLRGQAYVEMKEFVLACDDIKMAKQISPWSIFDNVLPFICN